MTQEQSETQEKQKTEPKEAKTAAPTAIVVETTGLTPKTSSELIRVVTQIAKGGGFPTIFKTLEQQVAAYNLASSLMGKQWQLAINNMYFIKGKLAIFGELPGTIAERTGEVAEKEIWLLDRDYTRICLANKNLDAAPWASVTTIQRKGRVKKEFYYTLDEATAAGQYPAMKPEYEGDRKTGRMVPNDDSPWNKHTKVMLMRKSMAMAIKFEFPEALVGVPIAEYDFDDAPDLKDVTPNASEDKADMLNKKFAGAQ